MKFCSVLNAQQIKMKVFKRNDVHLVKNIMISSQINKMNTILILQNCLLRCAMNCETTNAVNIVLRQEIGLLQMA